eukprot:CAMPEP_0171294092 /NCGR_PEP_ID=MMETSP0816-20121228/2471_1 /TAXON_ID=420281 /ORGANISM="Proboscia inermis, Strain CCAP1064/1" /LENGTH=409 /DNA_ID=CAMNT_0011765569 /DNA_START=160 /DNA_END=1389 /DNA_ORIENTATION=-
MDNGPVGFLQGVGKALVGAVIKPVVGVGDAAIVVMNHVSEVTSDEVVIIRIPKRLRRALPRVVIDIRNSTVQLVPFDESSSKVQKIVTAGDSGDDVYIGHVNIPGCLIITSEKYFWSIDRHTKMTKNLRWDDISHFSLSEEHLMRISVFTMCGLKSFTFKVDTYIQSADLYQLLSMQASKMGNFSNFIGAEERASFNSELENIGANNLPGFKSKQVPHLFGSCNIKRKGNHDLIKDDIDIIEQCFARVMLLGSENSAFLKSLDNEAWNLVNSWSQLYSGLSSRRCIVAGIINCTGSYVQVKSSALVEGGSPCYSIPSKEYIQDQGLVAPGGAIIFFGWGSIPSLSQTGNVFMTIETGAFACNLSGREGGGTEATALPGYEVWFLEKSYDSSSWWAKYWIFVKERSNYIE